MNGSTTPQNKISDKQINIINQRVKKVFLHLEKYQHIQKTEFARSIGMTTSFQLNKVWDNKNLISTRNLYFLEEVYKVNINWILTGKGDMFETDKEKEYEAKIAALEHDKNEILKALLQLKAEHDQLKKNYDDIFSLIEKLNNGGVFKVDLTKHSLKKS